MHFWSTTNKDLCSRFSDTNQIEDTMINFAIWLSICPEQWMTFQQAWLGFSCHTDMWTQILSCQTDTFCNSWPHNFSLSPVNPCSFSHVDSGKKYPSFLTRIFTGIAPMAPLGPGVSSKTNSNPRPGFSPYESHNIQTINTNGELLLGDDGQLDTLVGPTAKTVSWDFLTIATLLNCIISNHNNWMNVSAVISRALFCVESNVY